VFITREASSMTIPRTREAKVAGGSAWKMITGKPVSP
jgi:hypothetical protein